MMYDIELYVNINDYIQDPSCDWDVTYTATRLSINSDTDFTARADGLTSDTSEIAITSNSIGWIKLTQDFSPGKFRIESNTLIYEGWH